MSRGAGADTQRLTLAGGRPSVPSVRKSVRAPLAGASPQLVGVAGVKVLALEVLEDVLGGGGSVRIVIQAPVLALAGLDEGLLDLHVVRDHGVPPGSLAEPVVVLLDVHAHGVGELEGAVRDHLDRLKILPL